MLHSAVMVQAFVHLPAPAAVEPDDEESIPLRSGLSGSGIGTPQHCPRRGSISDSAMSTPKSSQPGTPTRSSQPSTPTLTGQPPPYSSTPYSSTPNRSRRHTQNRCQFDLTAVAAAFQLSWEVYYDPPFDQETEQAGHEWGLEWPLHTGETLKEQCTADVIEVIADAASDTQCVVLRWHAAGALMVAFRGTQSLANVA